MSAERKVAVRAVLEEVLVIVELGRVSVITNGCSPGPIIEPLVGSKVMRDCYTYC